MSQLGFVEKLSELGVNGVMRAAILGNVIGRMAKPASELATWNWLQRHSALGELIDFDFEAMPHTRLYHASDVLMKHRKVIDEHIFSAVQTLFGLDETVTLYDLTNTYFEGEAEGNSKAKRGHSKEKRSDCSLMTLGLILDGSGFVRRSRTFAGNVAESGTLEGMLEGLDAPRGALVIMDRGIATEANVGWLVEHGYRYLVVSRGGARQFDETQAIRIETAGGDPLRIQKEISEDGKEVRLYCHSLGREKKESAMVERFATGFENGLKKIVDGLAKPRGEKRHGKLLERIGRLKEKSRGASQHYQVELMADESGKLATGLTWEKVPVNGTMATHPGVYCLRSNETGWDEEKLWRTYTMLTDLESVFRSLKSELGLRPVYHSTEERADGHLFITVLAYQAVQVLRTKLKKADIHDSWASLRETMSVQ
ncbi:IS1634 family transposase, partial [Aquabacter sp. P-9]|uniref:IS1634 family transposase n=1 Tax=Aquabacter sediminis TaxID=3029197 RepID=UPI0031585DD0